MDVENEVPFSTSSSTNGFPAVKRQRTDEDSTNWRVEVSNAYGDNANGSFGKSTCIALATRRFLPVTAGDSVYHSEQFQPNGETLYTPLKEDVIINTRNIEQFTFAKGSFFIGDESSRFNRTVRGMSLNMWRFDEQKKKLYISRSFVFTDSQVVQDIKKLIEAL